MARTVPKFTYADLREMPDDGRRYEVVEGDLFVSPSPRVSHQMVVLGLYDLLSEARRAGFGQLLVAPTDVYFDEHNVVVPDAVFVCTDRHDIVTEDGVRGVPDLVAEVLSPGTRARDLGPKLHLYDRVGVSVYWVADPAARTISVYARTDAGGYGEAQVLHAGDVLTCRLFPGIEAPVADLFRR